MAYITPYQVNVEPKANTKCVAARVGTSTGIVYDTKHLTEAELGVKRLIDTIVEVAKLQLESGNQAKTVANIAWEGGTYYGVQAITQGSYHEGKFTVEDEPTNSGVTYFDIPLPEGLEQYKTSHQGTDTIDIRRAIQDRLLKEGIPSENVSVNIHNDNDFALRAVAQLAATGGLIQQGQNGININLDCWHNTSIGIGFDGNNAYAHIVNPEDCVSPSLADERYTALEGQPELIPMPGPMGGVVEVSPAYKKIAGGKQGDKTGAVLIAERLITLHSQPDKSELNEALRLLGYSDQQTPDSKLWSTGSNELTQDRLLEIALNGDEVMQKIYQHVAKRAGERVNHLITNARNREGIPIDINLVSVTGDFGNKLMKIPGTKSEFLSQIPEGISFVIEDLSLCGAGDISGFSKR